MLETSRLWREVVSGLAGEYADVALDHLLVDNAAMQLVADPSQFDVIVTENMFGDILSDEAAMITGSLGMLPSASLGDDGPGVFEPVHGSAPDIAGQGVANPLATFLSVAMMLRHGLGDGAAAERIEAAVEARARRRPAHRRPVHRGRRRTAGRHRRDDRSRDRGALNRDNRGPIRNNRPPEASKEEDVEKAESIWMNGEFVAWDDAKVHVLSHGLHYGTGVFEGIRAYETENGTAVFRHRDHLERLLRSAALYYLPMPFGVEELRAATNELIRRNGLASCYIRPIAFRGYGEMGLFAESPVEVTIATWPWGAYLGEEGKRTGIKREGLVVAPDLARTG